MKRLFGTLATHTNLCLLLFFATKNDVTLSSVFTVTPNMFLSQRSSTKRRKACSSFCSTLSMYDMKGRF